MSNIDCITGRSVIRDRSVHTASSQELAQFQHYQFVDGVLTINRMPITIAPRDTTLTYGQAKEGQGYEVQLYVWCFRGSCQWTIRFPWFHHTTHLATHVECGAADQYKAGRERTEFNWGRFQYELYGQVAMRLSIQGRLLIYARAVNGTPVADTLILFLWIRNPFWIPTWFGQRYLT